MNIALEVDLVGEHVDHFHHDVGRNARSHRREIETRIDRCAGTMDVGFELLLDIVCREGPVRLARDGDVVLNRRREDH